MSELRSTHTDALLANARHYQRRLFRPGAPRKPRTEVAVVTCMDARINVYSLLGLTEGDAHVVRNAGGVVTEHVIRSLTISQRLLNTRAVLIIMHAACGLREITEDQFTAELQAEDGSVRPGVQRPFATPRQRCTTAPPSADSCSTTPQVRFAR
jgi:carbonic anhydrase